MPTKPKTQYSAADDQLAVKDLFQTPDYALDPLLPYLQPFSRVWEPACGEGYLYWNLVRNGFEGSYGDLQLGKNFFADDPPAGAEVQVTNVPFAKKYRWVLRSLEMGIPFALLMPSDVLFAGRKFQPLMVRYDLRMLVPDKRINFKTPFLGWGDGEKTSSAQMHTSWVTWGLGLPERVTFCSITPRPSVELLPEQYLCSPQRALAARLVAEEEARKAKQGEREAAKATN